MKAIETDAKGTEKTFGKTEGLVFDDTTIADNAFTMKAHLSKTVAAGTYYFKVQAGDTVSEVASIVVTRTKRKSRHLRWKRKNTRLMQAAIQIREVLRSG